MEAGGCASLMHWRTQSIASQATTAYLEVPGMMRKGVDFVFRSDALARYNLVQRLRCEAAGDRDSKGVSEGPVQPLHCSWNHCGGWCGCHSAQSLVPRCLL